MGRDEFSSSISFQHKRLSHSHLHFLQKCVFFARRNGMCRVSAIMRWYLKDRKWTWKQSSVFYNVRKYFHGIVAKPLCVTFFGIRVCDCTLNMYLSCNCSNGLTLDGSQKLPLLTLWKNVNFAELYVHAWSVYVYFPAKKPALPGTIAFILPYVKDILKIRVVWGWRDDVDGEHWRTSACVNNSQTVCH